MITFRLDDSLPAAALTRLEQESKNDNAKRRQRLEAYLDTGNGACYLRDARVAQLVEAALLQFDGARYRLLSWVVMPNHVHVLIETLPDCLLSGMLHSWKSYTAKGANRLLGRSGAFWQPDYFDRVIRDEQHLAHGIEYIHWNPCKAGLARQPGDWPFSSAARLARAPRVQAP